MRYTNNYLIILTIFIPLIFGCASDEERKQSHFDKGVAYFENQEYAAAEIEFKNTLQIDPQYFDAHIYLARSLLKI